MIPYWIFFGYPAWKALTKPKDPFSPQQTLFLIIALSCVIGLRFEVGGDWEIYLENQASISGSSVLEVVTNTLQDPGFEFLSWLSDAMGMSIYGVNFICAFVFSIGLVSFCRAQPRPWFALTLSIPYLVIVVAMGYTRQSVAIGLAMLAILALEKSELRKFFLFLAFAAVFHKTAVIMSAAALPSIGKGGKLGDKLVKAFIIILIAAALAYTLLLPRLDFYLYGYEQQAMQSQGAGIRVAMNVLPAFLLVLLQRRFNLTSVQRVIWLGLAYLGLACVVGLVVFDSSTAVDRLALYCIPLQMFVGARLTDLNLVRVSKRIMTVIVVFAAASIQLIWLNFAITAFAWLPYKNILMPL